jgi:lipid II:glycine glycyltransferase (peptidoglycan interpeptide bridge formation enzyme)
MYTAMMDAKDQGFKVFDFWGIAPENAPKDHPWAGFTASKKGFGGYEVDYCGTYDIVLNKSKYRLYNLARKVNRTIRKLKS